MAFLLSNIYLSGSTTCPGKLEFLPTGLIWHATGSDRKIEVRPPAPPLPRPAHPSACTPAVCPSPITPSLHAFNPPLPTPSPLSPTHCAHR